LSSGNTSAASPTKELSNDLDAFAAASAAAASAAGRRGVFGREAEQLVIAGQPFQIGRHASADLRLLRRLFRDRLLRRHMQGQCGEHQDRRWDAHHRRHIFIRHA